MNADLIQRIEAYFKREESMGIFRTEAPYLLREALQTLKHHDAVVGAILAQAEAEIGTERLSGNIVKEEFWRGERSACIQIQNASL